MRRSMAVGMKTHLLRTAGLALLLVAALAACSSPVRLATPAEIKQATEPTASPAAGNAAPNPAASPGAGGTATPATGGLAELQAEYHALIAAVPLRREAPCCIPSPAGRNSEGGSWV